MRLANKPARGDASDSNRNPVAPDPNRADFNTKATAPDVSDKRIRVLGNNNVMKFGRHNLSLFCQSYHRVAHWLGAAAARKSLGAAWQACQE